MTAISSAGQQKLAALVSRAGHDEVRSLVEKGDVDALKQRGLSELDARALVAQARERGFDAVFRSAGAAKMFGAANGDARGAQLASEMGGKHGMPRPHSGSLSALVAVKGGTALDGIDASKIEGLNLKGLSLPKEIVKIADAVFAGRPNRIATAGYSAPPSGTAYAEHTEKLLGALAEKLGLHAVGFTTSPTADQGSIDAITTMLSQQKGIPVVSITAKDYVGYIDPSKFPPGMDAAKYAETPKHVFPDAAKYNQATALASNAFVATGGRDVTVYDFMRAVEAGHPVVLVVDASLAGALGDKAVWDADKKRPNNGAAYLHEQIASFLKTGELAHPPISKEGFGAFDAPWLKDRTHLLEKLVKVVHVSGPQDLEEAAAAAASHIAAFTSPSARQTMAAFHQTSIEEIKGSFQPSYLENAYRYSALTASQLASATKDVPGASELSAQAGRLLDDMVQKTVRHFGGGRYAMLDDPEMDVAAMRQHAGYVAGEMSRKLGLDAAPLREALVPFYQATRDGASAAAREELADVLASAIARSSGPVDAQQARERSAAFAELKRFVTTDDNGWMFNQYGFGDADRALNRPGVYAGAAVLELARSMSGSEADARALLSKALDRPASELARALERPSSREDFVAQFAARAAQAAWLISKAGQGIVEANHADPKKAEKGLARFAPKNDLITDFDALAQKKGWAEVAKDIDQVKTFLSGRSAG